MLWSIKNNSKLHYCSLICYWLVHTILAAADDKGCSFGHHCRRRMSPNSIKHRGQQNKLISTLILWIYWIASRVASERTCTRPPTPQAAWVHQIHVAGGASGSTTMVMVFGRWLCFLCVFFLLVTHQLDTSYLRFRGVTKCPTQACTIPIWQQWLNAKEIIFGCCFLADHQIMLRLPSRKVVSSWGHQKMLLSINYILRGMRSKLPIAKINYIIPMIAKICSVQLHALCVPEKNVGIVHISAYHCYNRCQKICVASATFIQE